MANQEVLCHPADDRWSFTRGTFAVKRFPMML
jgi:hypothetical protein